MQALGLMVILLALTLGTVACGEDEAETSPQGLFGATGATGHNGDCDSNYGGSCLDPNASDYDCEGGTGDGPKYTGQVEVVGSDPYDLDRDGDGVACDT